MALELTVIIPCHNDHAPLCRLLARLTALRIARRVIVVDDGSTPPLEMPPLNEAIAAQHHSPAPDLTLLRPKTNQGAGAARNLALEQVDTEHVMFMDADDLPTRELPKLCAALAGMSFDFCMFQHHDSRMDDDQLRGMQPFDQRLWAEAGALHRAIAPIAPPPSTEASALVQTANYPWNKIYQSAFLETHNIRCSATRVHNDIELHWRSFFHAQTALSSDHVAMIHFITKDGTRITNRRGEERLDIFVPLTRLGEHLADPALAAFRYPFFRFALGLLLWAQDTIQAELHPRFATQARAFVQRNLMADTCQILRAKDAQLLDQVTARLGIAFEA